MRAVNLIPADARRARGSRGPSTGMQIPVYVLLGLLAAAVGLVTLYVLANNSLTARKATLSSLQAQVAQEQAAVTRLGEFTKFSQLAQTRISTVRSIATARFDWHTALSDLSKVVPANTTLQSVVGTVVPGASTGGGSGGTGSLRSAISAPAFDLTGCTRTQDDVARLMSQLRLINGVTRVSFSTSQVTSTSSSSAPGTSGVSCPAGSPNFDIVVFFTPVANAGPAGVTSVGASAATASPATTTTPASTTAPATTTTPGTTTTPATKTTPGGTS